jgi:hypothetical protein
MDALGELGCQLGGDEDDENVAEDVSDVHGAGQIGAAWTSTTCAVPAQAATSRAVGT